MTAKRKRLDRLEAAHGGGRLAWREGAAYLRACGRAALAGDRLALAVVEAVAREYLEDGRAAGFPLRGHGAAVRRTLARLEDRLEAPAFLRLSLALATG